MNLTIQIQTIMNKFNLNNTLNPTKLPPEQIYKELEATKNELAQLAVGVHNAIDTIL